MNRLRDYVGFAVWFAGLGYMAIWPLSANGSGGALFGASLLCRAPAPQVLATLCRAPHPLILPPGLHVLGLLSAIAVALRLTCRVLRRGRRAGDAATNRAMHPRLLSAPPAKPRPLPRVKPRSQFGLRGMPR